MNGDQKQLPDDQNGECLGDFTDAPTGPLSSLWASTRGDVHYEAGDPSDAIAWRTGEAKTLPAATPIPADRGSSPEERAWRLKAEQRLAAMLREINGGYGI